MIKLLDILKEVNIQPKSELGSGLSFVAYPSKIDPSKVIKTTIYDEPEKLQDHAYMFMKYPKYFPKVYKYMPNKYLVIEKLNTRPIIEYYNKLEPFSPYPNPFRNIPSYNPKKFDPENYLDVAIKQHPELLEMTLKLKKLYNDVDKILEKERYDELDFHSENIGLDDKGNIKLLDF